MNNAALQQSAMRTVHPLDESTAARYPDNTVVNSRYTLWTFLPVNLYEQFRKPVNFYFLLVAALQFISVIAPVNPLSTLLPLLFAFTLTAAKEGYDDYKRHQQDKAYNSRRVVHLDPCTHSWAHRASRQLRVGDIIRLQCNEEIPCDVVCIAAPAQAEGVVLIRTDNLDGELDLKPRDVVPATVAGSDAGSPTAASCNRQLYSDTTTMEELVSVAGKLSLICPPPSAVISAFDARRDVLADGGAAAGGTVVSLSLNETHLLPQACVVKTTGDIIAVVVYTGDETKCGMNKHDPPPKWANIDQAVSRYSKYIFACQICVAVVFGVVAVSRNGSTLVSSGMWYLGATAGDSLSSSAFGDYLIYLLRFFLLTTVMIPVSFKFVVDLSKHFMALVLEWDLAMYNPEIGTGIKVRNSSIVEDLGQIQHILTDKTGTLTENRMILQHITVGEAKHVDIFSLPVSCDGPSTSMAVSSDLEDMLHCALLCNTIEVSHEADTQRVCYHGASPDEEAICTGILRLGYRVVKRTKSEVILKDSRSNMERHFRVLRVFPFSSEKKCMGVIVEGADWATTEHASSSSSSKIRLVLKGADDKMFHFASKKGATDAQSPSPDPPRELQPTSRENTHLNTHLETYARRGLRTLVFGAKWLSSAEYAAFEHQYQHALNEVHNRQHHCDALETALEEGIDILGGTAIEDRLQDDVKETITDCVQTGIRVWMLTGDKVETAEQIAIACGLMDPHTDTALKVVDRHHGNETLRWQDALRDGASRVRRSKRRSSPAHDCTSLLPAPALPLAHSGGGGCSAESDSELASSDSSHGAGHVPSSSSSHRHHVLIVQGGPVLDQILRTPEMLATFKELAMSAKSVVCARVTPSQKAVVTELVRSSGFITLAIGDGGNDVAMIQQAHVGVGIAGREGSQASRAADFSVSRFAHLRSLLFVHGHSSFARTAYVVQYSFYKSMLIAFIQLMFNVRCTFVSGASFWNSFALTMWNGVYTLPQTLCFCLDRVTPRVLLEKHPELYRQSQASTDFNAATFTGFVLRGVLQSAALFWLAESVTGSSYAENHTGFTASHDVTITIAYSSIVLLQTATVVLESSSLTLINLVVIVGMPAFYYITVFLYASVRRFAYFQVFQHTDDWQGFVLAFGIAAALFFPHMLFSSLRAWWCPKPREALRQRYITQRLQRASLGQPIWRQVWSSLWMSEEPSIFSDEGRWVNLSDAA